MLNFRLQIIVWYVRYDGEVVPDSREIDMSKCLPHQVGISWPVARAEQGTTQKLTLSAEPYSLCSLGELMGKSSTQFGSLDRIKLDRRIILSTDITKSDTYVIHRRSFIFMNFIFPNSSHVFLIASCLIIIFHGRHIMQKLFYKC